MVHLSIHSPKGNLGARFYPYTGFLGLTPVKVEGVVRTKVDDDGKTLLSKSVTVAVRCYESRLGRVGVLHSNVLVEHIQVLWSKPDDQEWADVGDLELPFRLTLPTKIAGHSTATYPDYRVFWRIEAVINHIQQSGLGYRLVKHVDLPFIRYDLPTMPYPPLPPPQFQFVTSKSRTSVSHYRVDTPVRPIGPHDLVSLSMFLCATDPSVSIRSVSLTVERRIQLFSSSTPQLPLATPPSPSSLPPYSPSTPPCEDSINGIGPSKSHTSLAPSPSSTSLSSATTDSTLRPLVDSTATTSINGSPTYLDVTSRTITDIVIGLESSGGFVRKEGPMWTKTVSFQWPAAKSNGHWSIGETICAELASVGFFARIKIVVSSSSGTESLDLAEQELFVVSTNEAQRELATSKYNEALSASLSSSKAKSPRRMKRDSALPSPPRSPPSSASSKSFRPGRQQTKHDSLIMSPSKESSRYPITGERKKIRRPHTSPRLLLTNPFDVVGSKSGLNDTVDGRASTNSLRRLALGDSGDSNETSETPSGETVVPLVMSLGRGRECLRNENERRFEIETAALDQIRAWEMELTKIEARSLRNSTDMVGFFKRKPMPIRQGPAGQGVSA